ncbi:MAG: putative solute-binding protein [Acidiferrobacteraceae bacterium]
MASGADRPDRTGTGTRRRTQGPKTRLRHVLYSVGIVLLLALGPPAWAGNVRRTLCVFDVSGASGAVYQLMQDYAIEAQRWGVDFRLRPYTDESTAKDDFEAGKCAAVELTGVRNRSLVKFAGSLDMMAALPDYKALHLAIDTISSPRAAPLMRAGPYETVGIFPGGAVYLFGRDRRILTDYKALTGARMSVLSYDQQAVQMARFAGVSMVPANISTFGSLFNNGSVTLCYAPALAYFPLELYKGLGTRGGILQLNLGMLTFQIDTHWKRFPKDFGARSRSWVARHDWRPAMQMIRRVTTRIPARYWVRPSRPQASGYRQMFAEVRQQLWQQHVYSRRMQVLLKRIRCREHPADPECSSHMEGPPVP